MKFILTEFVVCAIAVQFASTTVVGFSLNEGWNELLNAGQLFDGSVNMISVKSNEDGVILDELKNMLNQTHAIKNVYYKYRSIYKIENESGSLDDFKLQLIKIATHNLEANSGKHSWWMGINKFTDMKPSQLKQAKGGFVPLKKATPSIRRGLFTSPTAPPASLNYVEQNRVSPVKNQLGCDNACAMFAFTSALESADAISANRETVLEGSVQELVDCATPNYCCDEPAGCNRSHMVDIWDHITRVGLSAQDLYPYTDPPTTGTCRTNLTPILKAKKQVGKEEVSVKQMKQYLVDNGPLVIYMYASETFKQSFGKGIYDGADCGTEGINHAVTLVGYGSEGGHDYWLCKNSFGTQWGEEGYFKIVRAEVGVCNTLAEALWLEV